MEWPSGSYSSAHRAPQASMDAMPFGRLCHQWRIKSFYLIHEDEVIFPAPRILDRKSRKTYEAPTSTASSGWQCSRLTSTTSFGWQCSPPDLNRKCQITVGTNGPQHTTDNTQPHNVTTSTQYTATTTNKKTQTNKLLYFEIPHPQRIGFHKRKAVRREKDSLLKTKPHIEYLLVRFLNFDILMPGNPASLPSQLVVDMLWNWYLGALW